MNTEIKTYTIPSNPKVIKGHIYTLYINNNTNLDLSAVIGARNINLQGHNSLSSTPISSSIMISEKDYTRLLELNNLAYQLTNKRTTSIQNFLNEETKTVTELTKINTERENLVKKLTKVKEQQHE